MYYYLDHNNIFQHNNENRIRGGSELKQMLGICNMNLTSLEHGNNTIFDNTGSLIWTSEKLTFDKTVKKFPFAFVQFDDGSSAPSSLQKMFEFSKLASEFLSHNSDILAAQVRFRWGDVETKKMANRFQVRTDFVHFRGLS